MPKITARKASLYLDDQLGACQSISPLVSKMDLKFTAESTEVTGFGNDNRERVADGMRDWELTLDGFWAAGASGTDTYLGNIRAAGGSTLLRMGPGGSASGCPMYAACAVLTDYSIDLDANGAAAISFTLAARTGSLTRTTASWA